MKKVFSRLSFLVFIMSCSVLAVARTNTIYQNISHCKLRYSDTSGKTTQYNISLLDNSNNTKLYVVWVSTGSLSRVEGMHQVPLYSTTLQDYTCYFYDTDNFKWSNPSGYAEFRFTGRYSGSDPIYYVHFKLRGYYGRRSGNYDTCDFIKEIPVIMTDIDDHRIEINNDVKVVNIPGCDSHVSARNEGYFNYIGQSEQYLFRFETLSVDNDEGRFLGLGTNVDDDYTWNQLLPDGDLKQTGDASCDVTQYNGYYFFEGYFNYNNACFYVTMQYPNYQANNNSYTQSFEFESATLTRRSDFETSGVVTLTATNENNKKVVLDFVVDKEAVGNTGEIIIPAGNYTISTSEEQNTIIASGGINYDLSVKNSYAGTTTPLNATNYSTNPLWCLRTGVVTVEDGMSTITVEANQNYRNAPVNITIRKAPSATYTATFYGEGLSGNVYQTELNEGDAVRAPELPERTDANGTYVFSGWFSDYTNTVITDFSGVTMPAQNVTYYATWTLTQNEHICLDGDNDTMESLPAWQLVGTGSFFDDHNAYYEEEGDHAMNDDFANFRPFEETKDIKDILRISVNGSIVDSITYILHWTASPKYSQYMRGLGVVTDGRVDLGTFYVDEKTNYTNDGHIYTIADLGEKTKADFSLKIADGTKTYHCDSIVKFTLARTPVTATYTLTWDANGGTIEDDETGDIVDKIVVTDITTGTRTSLPLCLTTTLPSRLCGLPTPTPSPSTTAVQTAKRQWKGW